MIDVVRTGRGDRLEFEVRVRAGGGETRHRVSLARATYERLAQAGQTPEDCVDAAFRFLLDREPKEAILARFDIAEIARYFPDFERELPRYLARA